MSDQLARDRLVKIRIKMRDAKTAMKKAFELEYDKITQQEDVIDAEFKRMCQEEGTTGFKTEFGTVSLVETLKTSCADWTAFKEFLADEDPLNWLTNSIKSAAVKDYMKDHEGMLPPGVSIFKELTARVRRAGEQ